VFDAAGSPGTPKFRTTVPIDKQNSACGIPVILGINSAHSSRAPAASSVIGGKLILHAAGEVAG
jgi:hypothetical protein